MERSQKVEKVIQGRVLNEHNNHWSHYKTPPASPFTTSSWNSPTSMIRRQMEQVSSWITPPNYTWSSPYRRHSETTSLSEEPIPRHWRSESPERDVTRRVDVHRSPGSSTRLTSSPHRIIHTPDPDNSPARWIPVRDTDADVPPVKVKRTLLHDTLETTFRPYSQNTYTVEQEPLCYDDIPVGVNLQSTVPMIRKRMMLQEAAPEKVNTATGHTVKRMESGAVENGRREVGPATVKVTKLNEVLEPEKDVAVEYKTEVAVTKPRTARKTGQGKKKPEIVVKKMVIPDVEEKKAKPVKKMKKQESIPAKTEDNEVKTEDKVKEMLLGLDEVIKLPLALEEKEKASGSNTARTSGFKSQSSIKSKQPDAVDKKSVEVPVKKRTTDTRIAQDYMKTQKQKRSEQMKTEKQQKLQQMEFKRKKLEELRAVSLKLAAASKRKSSKVVPTERNEWADCEEPSLGLRLEKPKISFNESIQKLKLQTNVSEQVPVGEVNKTDVEPSQLVEEPIRVPVEVVPHSREDGVDVNVTLKKLAETLNRKLDTKMKNKSGEGSRVPPQKVIEESARTVDDRYVTIDKESLEAMRAELREMAENFTLLHNTLKVGDGEKKERETEADDSGTPVWLKNVLPQPQPYNFMTAFRNKMNLPVKEEVVEVEQPIPTRPESSSDERYFSVGDSGSELSSGVLDSKQDRSASTLSSFRENIMLVPPDLRLVPSDRQYSVIEDLCLKTSRRTTTPQDSWREPQFEFKPTEPVQEASQSSSDTIRTELSHQDLNTNLVDNLKLKIRQSPPSRDDAACQTSFVKAENPTPLSLTPMEGLKLQTDHNILESFQQTLREFLSKSLENEQAKHKVDEALSPFREQQSDQISENIESSVKTEIEEEIVEDNSSTISEAITEHSTSVKEGTSELDTNDVKLKKVNKKLPDKSSDVSTMSLQALEQMLKYEELHAEHQLALLNLRSKSLKEKTKAEISQLQSKKINLKSSGGDGSTVRKKLRGILMKYQQERESIDRLKRMYAIASDDRKLMSKQQQQIKKMQTTTKDLIRSQKKEVVKKSLHEQVSDGSEIPEEISEISVQTSINQSIVSDFDVSSKSIDTKVVMKRNVKMIQGKARGDKLQKCKKLLSEQEKKLLLRRNSVEEILKWKKRLEDEELYLKEMERQAVNMSKGKKVQKISLRDRSTSPFQFNSEVEVRKSSSSENSETKRTSSVSEASDLRKKDDKSRTDAEESIPEKLQSSPSASEEIAEDFSRPSQATSSARTVSEHYQYNSESFESPSSSETHKSQVQRSKSLDNSYSKSKGITIKVPLSPRTQGTRRRYSSGSDESINLSHTETASEQSDVEGRITALHEQLRRRKLEADRLRREHKRIHRERLKAKEQSLLKQIQAYDSYIQKARLELEQGYEHSTQAIVKPQIKQPKVAEKGTLKKQEAVQDVVDTTKVLTKQVVEVTAKESDSESVPASEISEAIQEESESIKENLSEFSVHEESSVPEDVRSTESQSDSEEPSADSIKTAVQSPEKVDVDLEQTFLAETETKQEPTETEKFSYSTDSFESDLEEEEEGKKEEEEEDVEEEEEEESEIVEEVSVLEEPPKNTAQVDQITESILEHLLSESVEMFERKMSQKRSVVKQQPSRNVEEVTELLLSRLVKEAVDDMLAIRKKVLGKVKSEECYDEEAAISPSRVTSDVRRKIHEIMANSQGASPKKHSRLQDVMTTTFGAMSPAPSTSPGEDDSEEEKEAFLLSLSISDEQNSVGGHKTTPAAEVDGFGQEWFDEDYGLSKSRREAEELRLQQLQIEQEIQQLQAQQEQVPYYYVREIPNKPPPPYTPPGEDKKPVLVDKDLVPKTETELLTIVRSVTDVLYKAVLEDKDVTTVQIPQHMTVDADSQSVQCYKQFLFDLTKQLVCDIFKSDDIDDELPPWEQASQQSAWRKRLRNLPRTLTSLNNIVDQQILVLFGFKQKINKENLIIRWSRKKRDHVDELLVSESQEEESEWTEYDKDEISIKNDVTQTILDNLLNDTVRLFKDILKKKQMKVSSQTNC